MIQTLGKKGLEVYLLRDNFMRELVRLNIYKITEEILNIENGDLEGEFIYDEKTLYRIDDFIEDSVVGCYDVNFTPLTMGVFIEFENLGADDFLDIDKNGSKDWNILLDHMIKNEQDSLLLVWDIQYSKDYYTGEFDVDFNYEGVLNLSSLTIIKDEDLKLWHTKIKF